MFDQYELQHRIKRITNFISLLFVKQHCAHFCKYIVDDCVPADLWENKINYKKRLYLCGKNNCRVVNVLKNTVKYEIK